MKKISKEYVEIRTIEFISQISKAGIYNFLSYALIMGSMALILNITSLENIWIMLLYAMAITFQILTGAIFVFYVYVDPQGTDSYWLMNEIFNDLALLILLIFNLRVFIYVTLGNMIQNKLKTYMYNIYLDFFDVQYASKELDELPIVKVMIVFAIPIVIFEFSIFLSLSCSLPIKIFMAIGSLIILYVVTKLLIWFFQ